VWGGGGGGGGGGNVSILGKLVVEGLTRRADGARLGDKTDSLKQNTKPDGLIWHDRHYADFERAVGGRRWERLAFTRYCQYQYQSRMLNE